MSRPDAAFCLGRLGRLAALQSRAITAGRTRSLGRILRLKQFYIALLDSALLAGKRPAAGDGNFEKALRHLAEEDERNVRRAVRKLEEIWAELESLKNKGKLLGTYGR